MFLLLLSWHFSKKVENNHEKPVNEHIVKKKRRFFAPGSIIIINGAKTDFYTSPKTDKKLPHLRSTQHCMEKGAFQVAKPPLHLHTASSWSDNTISGPFCCHSFQVNNFFESVCLPYCSIPKHTAKTIVSCRRDGTSCSVVVRLLTNVAYPKARNLLTRRKLELQSP